jgi:hypothetical protein
MDVLFESRLSPSEDWGLWLRIAARHDVIVSPEVLTRNHLSADGLSFTAPLDRYERIYRALYDQPGDELLAAAIARERRALEANVRFLTAGLAYERHRPWRARWELLKALAITPRRLRWTTVFRIALLAPGAAQAIGGLRRRLARSGIWTTFDRPLAGLFHHPSHQTRHRRVS